MPIYSRILDKKWGGWYNEITNKGRGDSNGVWNLEPEKEKFAQITRRFI